MTNLPTTYVSWYCRNCGHENETDKPSYSYPAKCPSCGENKISHDTPKLPVNDVYCDSEPRQYSWTSDEKEIQVYMRSMNGGNCGIALNPEYVPDCSGDPIEVVREVLHILETQYWFNSSKEKVQKILKEMEECEEQSNKNAKINRVHELRKNIVLDSHEYLSLIEETVAV